MLSLHELLLGNMTAKAQATKERKKEIDFTEVKSFKNKCFLCVCFRKQESEEIKHTEWEKIFVNHVSDKDISRICKELL